MSLDQNILRTRATIVHLFRLGHCAAILVGIWLLQAAAYAQSSPVITPNKEPILLHLNNNGKYTTALSDIASVTGVSNPATQVNVEPASFDCSQTGNQQVIVTAVNGNFSAAVSANSATFNHPYDMTADAAGNLYITDQLGNTIRKITAGGQVTTIAGNGRPVSQDGIGLNAGFDAPSGIVCDKNGNLYVTDYNSGLIREITPGGTVSTLAGNNMGYAEEDGLGIAASFNEPAGITIDRQGNLYVADQGASRIRMITPDRMVTTIAGSSPGYADGNGTGAHFDGPAGLVADQQGNVYVTDDYNHRIRKIDAQRNVTTVAGSSNLGSYDGVGTSAGFDGLVGITVDGQGNLYVAESGIVGKIRKISPQAVVTTIAGNGIRGYLDNFAPKAEFNDPTAVLFDKKGNLYIADDANNRIRILTTKGLVTTFAGTSSSTDGDGTILTPPTVALAKMQIPVTVVSSATLKDNLLTAYTVGAGSCGTLLTDYRQYITAADNCTGAPILFTQSPAPGTMLTAGETMNITVSTMDPSLSPFAVTFPVSVTEENDNNPTVTVAASADTICAGTPVTFTAEVTNEYPANYTWMVNGIVSGPNSATFASNQLSNNDEVTCSISNSACAVPVTSKPVVIKVNAVPVITLGQLPPIVKGQGIQLQPTVAGGTPPYKFSWLPATWLDDPSSPSPIVKPNSTTTYYLTVQSATGCSATDSTTVTVLNTISIPNAFTPNGDNINDTWVIEGLDNTSLVKVFSRYGAEVYESRGYATAWDGTHNGKRLPAGVYYYIVSANNDKQTLSGWVAIIY